MRRLIPFLLLTLTACPEGWENTPVPGSGAGYTPPEWVRIDPHPDMAPNTVCWAWYRSSPDRGEPVGVVCQVRDSLAFRRAPAANQLVCR